MGVDFFKCELCGDIRHMDFISPIHKCKICSDGDDGSMICFDCIPDNSSLRKFPKSEKNRNKWEVCPVCENKDICPHCKKRI
jgi:hypothetical protein